MGKRNLLLAFGLMLNGITYILAQDHIIEDPLRIMMYCVAVGMMIIGIVRNRNC